MRDPKIELWLFTKYLGCEGDVFPDNVYAMLGHALETLKDYIGVKHKSWMKDCALFLKQGYGVDDRCIFTQIIKGHVMVKRHVEQLIKLQFEQMDLED